VFTQEPIPDLEIQSVSELLDGIVFVGVFTLLFVLLILFAAYRDQQDANLDVLPSTAELHEFLDAFRGLYGDSARAPIGMAGTRRMASYRRIFLDGKKKGVWALLQSRIALDLQQSVTWLALFYKPLKFEAARSARVKSLLLVWTSLLINMARASSVCLFFLVLFLFLC
jgi:hypothetical protein